MSTQAGLFERSGQATTLTIPRALLTSMRVQAPDGISELSLGPVALAFGAFHTTAHDGLERQPLWLAQRYLITWDGRLDNRNELVPFIDCAPDATDVEIVAALFLRTGSAAFERLIGDFALVIADTSERVVWLARDFSGCRPLYYAECGHQAYWSSELVGLAHLLAPVGLNERWVADHLARGSFATPFVGIHAVLPGHAVRIGTGGITTHRFWWPRLDELSYTTDGEYEEHFRTLLTNAIRSRLRARGPVWIELSGGLDSSTNVCIAQRLCEAGKVQACNIQPVSIVFDGSPEADERRYISIIEECVGITSHKVSEDAYPLTLNIDGIKTSEPYGFSLRAEQAIAHAMCDHGSRVLMTGLGGDELLGNSSSPMGILADHLRRADMSTFVRATREWSNALGRPRWRLAADGLQGLLPHSVERLLGIDSKDDWRRLLSPTFLRNVYDKAVQRKPLFFSSCLPSQRARLAGIDAIIRHISSQPYRALFPMNRVHPYLDRALVEFLLRVPANQLKRPRERRSLMRRALRGILPEPTRVRRGKGSPSAAIHRAVLRDWATIEAVITQSSLVRRGYFRAAELPRWAQRVAHGIECASLLEIFVMLDQWLAQLEIDELVTPAMPKSMISASQLRMEGGETLCGTNGPRSLQSGACLKS